MPEPVTWAVVCLALVSTISGVTMAALGRLSSRDKLKYDGELIVVKQQQKDCEESHAKCDDRVSALEARLDKLHGVRTA